MSTEVMQAMCREKLVILIAYELNKKNKTIKFIFMTKYKQISKAELSINETAMLKLRKMFLTALKVINTLHNIIIIMVIFMCYFSGELIALSLKNIKKQQRCEHRIRKNKQIKSTVHYANYKMK